MFKTPVLIALMAALPTFAAGGLAQAQNLPSLAGSYRCVPEPESCKWQGQALSITQTGPVMRLTISPTEFAEAKLTSPISISAGPPFNALGRVLPNNTIEWTNGTKWVKQ
jgi:hypothetical protein